MPVGQLSDESLINRVTSGDPTALEMLYDRYAAMVMGISLKIVRERTVAEEILQETFWRIWQHPDNYQSQRGSVRDWILRIARNLAIDASRHGPIHPQTIHEAMDSDPIPNRLSNDIMGVPEQTQSSLDSQQVRNILLTLPCEQRQVIEMAYFYGMTRQEIAEATGEALSTIYTHAQLGLQKLRAEIKREFEPKSRVKSEQKLSSFWPGK